MLLPPSSSGGACFDRNALSSAASTSSQQALLSFPVDDLEPFQEDCGLLESEPGSPRSTWLGAEEGDAHHAPAAAAGAGGMGSPVAAASAAAARGSRGPHSAGLRGGRSSAYASLAAMQAVASGAVGILQQLAVPWGGLLDQEGLQAHPQEHYQQQGALKHVLGPLTACSAVKQLQHRWWMPAMYLLLCSS